MTIKNIICDTVKEALTLEDLLLREERFIIFGAGGAGRDARAYLERKGKEVLYLSDNDEAKHGTVVDGLKVLGPKEISSHGLHVIIASYWAREIALQLRELGITGYSDLSSVSNESLPIERWAGHFDAAFIEENLEVIEETYNWLADESSKETFLSLLSYRLTLDPARLSVAPFGEYLHPLVRAEAGEVIIDGGAWTGDTALETAVALKGKCRIFSFEPEDGNYERLQANINESSFADIVTPIKRGLWHSEETLYLGSNADNSKQFSVDSSVNPSCDEGLRIEVTSIDSFSAERSIEPTLIKMDIEGSECEALNGAREVIRRNRPKLQISIYHKPGDLWLIPALIREILPGYRFYLSHHSQNLFESTLYALPERLEKK